jgi:hypothetical protein
MSFSYDNIVMAFDLLAADMRKQEEEESRQAWIALDLAYPGWRNNKTRLSVEAEDEDAETQAAVTKKRKLGIEAEDEDVTTQAAVLKTESQQPGNSRPSDSAGPSVMPTA